MSCLPVRENNYEVIPQNEIYEPLNPKKVEVGSVVYFLEEDTQYSNCTPCLQKISFGIVAEHYPSCVAIQLIVPRDRRLIDGIPVKEFKTPSKWQKLPKDWSYDMQLFQITYDEKPDGFDKIDFKNPQEILKAYQDGILVNVQDNNHCYFTTEINSHKGWRIVRQYDDKYRPNWVSVTWRNVCKSYEEAKERLLRRNNRVKSEFQHLANLSDYDYAVSQIDLQLQELKVKCNISDEKFQHCREFLLSQDDVEKIETKIDYTNKTLLWRYTGKKRWMEVV